jgi:hypothetical protein
MCGNHCLPLCVKPVPVLFVSLGFRLFLFFQSATLTASVVAYLSHLDIGLVIPAERHDRNGFHLGG